MSTAVDTTTPVEIEIVPRNVDFALNRSRIRDWQSGDENATILWNALSLMFPHGERFFIDAVLKNRKYVSDAKLAAEVKAFVQQEAYHTREHIEYNEAMQSFVDAERLDREVLDHLTFVKKVLPDGAPLLVTCALEHFTAIMAKTTLEHHDAFLANAEPSYARLWTWHALEESEHKAVSYDVYLAKYGGDKKLWSRRRIMFLATVVLFRFIAKHMFVIMKARGTALNPVAWAKVLYYTFGNPGLMRRIAPHYVKYYKKNFHPNDIDDTAELARGRQLVETFA